MPIDPRQIEVMDDRMAEIIRGKSPTERLGIAFGMWRSARRMLRSMLRAKHPEWTEEQLNREVSLRMSHGAR